VGCGLDVPTRQLLKGLPVYPISSYGSMFVASVILPKNLRLQSPPNFSLSLCALLGSLVVDVSIAEASERGDTITHGHRQRLEYNVADKNFTSLDRHSLEKCAS
jgi:hypothetical protein